MLRKPSGARVQCQSRTLSLHLDEPCSSTWSFGKWMGWRKWDTGFCPGLGWAALDGQNCKAEITEQQKAAKNQQKQQEEAKAASLGSFYLPTTPGVLQHLQKKSFKSSFLMISPKQALSPSTSGMFLPLRN